MPFSDIEAFAYMELVMSLHNIFQLLKGTYVLPGPQYDGTDILAASGWSTGQRQSRTLSLPCSHSQFYRSTHRTHPNQGLKQVR